MHVVAKMQEATNLRCHSYEISIYDSVVRYKQRNVLVNWEYNIKWYKKMNTNLRTGVCATIMVDVSSPKSSSSRGSSR